MKRGIRLLKLVKLPLLLPLSLPLLLLLRRAMELVLLRKQQLRFKRRGLSGKLMRKTELMELEM
jgi:hypothetical protein